MTGLEPNTVISILGLALLGIGGMIGMMPVGTCPHCGHCKLEKLARDRERDVESGRLHRVPFCMVCGRHHRADEEHQR